MESKSGFAGVGVRLDVAEKTDAQLETTLTPDPSSWKPKLSAWGMDKNFCLYSLEAVSAGVFQLDPYSRRASCGLWGTEQGPRSEWDRDLMHRSALAAGRASTSLESLNKRKSVLIQLCEPEV